MFPCYSMIYSTWLYLFSNSAESVPWKWVGLPCNFQHNFSSFCEETSSIISEENYKERLSLREGNSNFYFLFIYLFIYFCGGYLFICLRKRGNGDKFDHVSFRTSWSIQRPHTLQSGRTNICSLYGPQLSFELNFNGSKPPNPPELQTKPITHNETNAGIQDQECPSWWP